MLALRATGKDVDMRRIEFVGPNVGEELTEQGGLAMLTALICILIYVAMRFEWRFALGSVSALAHDVIITLGLFSVLQLEFDLTILAAVLAVIGYSLNDTIVVSDRIRENFRKIRKAESEEIINISLTQTLNRNYHHFCDNHFGITRIIFCGWSINSWLLHSFIIWGGNRYLFFNLYF